MRVYTNEALRIEYPDLIAPAFDTVGINISALTPTANQTFDITVIVERAYTDYRYEDTRTAYQGEVSFDISPYIRAIMSHELSDPFAVSAYGYTALCQDITIKISYYNVEILEFNVNAIWGSVQMGHVWNGDRTIHLWERKPNIYGLFVNQGSRIDGGAEYTVPNIITNQILKTRTAVFADGVTSPFTLSTLSTDWRMLVTADQATDIIPYVRFKITRGEGAIFREDTVDGVTYLVVGTAESDVVDMSIEKAGCKITGWTMEARATDNGATFITSNGQSVSVGNSLQTIVCEGINSDHDLFTILTGTPHSDLYIKTLEVVLTQIDNNYATGTKTVTCDNFLTYERTGRRTLLGRDHTVVLTFVEESDCDKGLFLRWIDRGGFPVSWLFRMKEPSRKVKATDAMRSSMDGILIDNGVNGSVILIDDKEETVTLPVAYPMATADDYAILRTLLMSPVVEAWNEEYGYWYRVRVEDGTFSRSGAVREDFEFKVTLPAEEAQRL